MFPESPHRILVVEDDPNDMRLLQRAMDAANIDVPVSRLTNGDEAVDYLQGKPPYDNRKNHPLPTLVLLDLKLPRRSGLEVLAWIRSQPHDLGRTVVVILTSSQMTVDVRRAYDLRANSYLVKPDNGADLTAIAKELKRYWLGLNIAATV
ncbi:MAG TPA: response regulator [Terriglobales bacterium]|jgi:CheY-like chemotaxis protein